MIDVLGSHSGGRLFNVRRVGAHACYVDAPSSSANLSFRKEM